MPFHRLTTPTYFGGLPGGYDYLNTPSDPSVGGTGVPANVDPKKVGGANDGTYFVAWTEDGTSKHFNRPAAALGQNTDFIDDTLRQSIPKFAQLDLTAVGSVTTVALTGQIFVGEFGMANNATNRNLLVHITDQSDNNDLEVGGTKISAALIHDGASANVVGLSADGFRTNASVNFSPAIPNGTNYRVWYGVRSSLNEIARTEKGAYFKYIMRITEHINGTLRGLLRTLHSEASVNQAFDSAWDSTIRSLASSGLDDRYRRSTTQPAGFITANYNVAGGGAIIIRDGQAVTVKTKAIDITTDLYPDANLAGLKVIPQASRQASGASAYDATQGGDIGYWHESDYKNFPAADFLNEVVRNGPAGPALLDVLPRDLRSGTIATHTALTFINDQSNATLNPASGSSTDAKRTVQCAAGQYFGFTGSSESSIRLKTDLLEVRYTTGPRAGTTETYVVDFVAAANQVYVRRLNGTNADFGTTAVTGVRIRWIQTLVSIGNSGGRDVVEGLGNRNRSLFVTAPSYISNSAASETPGAPAFFGAAREAFVDGSWWDIALEWGGFSGTTGNYFRHGILYGDGSILTTKLASSGAISAVGQITTGVEVICGQSLENRPEQYFHLREDWLHLNQTFSPNLIQSDHLWQFNEVSGTFTVNNGTPSAKNPGVLEIIGAGGSATRILSIYATTLFPHSFATLDHMTVVLRVKENTPNLATSFGVGLVQSTTAQDGGTDALSIFWSPSSAWSLTHRKASGSGTHDNAALGAYVNNQFVTVRFKRLPTTGDVQIYFNDVLIVTVLVADLPSGTCTFNLLALQSVADANSSSFSCDVIDLRFNTGANRNGV